MSGERATWPALESNPDAMNKFLRLMGVKEPTQMVDVYGFDDDLLAMVPKPVHACLLVLPPNEKVASSRQTDFNNADEKSIAKDAFFMPQKIRNACGTFALIHALANNAKTLNIKEGPLAEFLGLASGVTASERSEVLQAFASLAQAHNTCAEQGDTREPENVQHHFICFVRLNDQLVEIGSLGWHMENLAVGWASISVERAYIM